MVSEGGACGVSVVIPCYNSAATLGRALDSVALQEWGDFEVIVINDAGEDASALSHCTKNSLYP